MMNNSPKINRKMTGLYADFTHRTIDRRKCITHLSALAGGVAATFPILSLFEADYAQAALDSQGSASQDEYDSRLKTSKQSFMGSYGSMFGYVARPADVWGRLPTILVVHDNLGLNDHIKDVTRRVALEGFVAFAPDFLSGGDIGNLGTPDDPDKAGEMIKALEDGTTLENALACVSHLKYRREAPFFANGKVGAIGFGWGGTLVNQIAVNTDLLNAGVVFYGAAPKTDDVPNITAKMLLHYASLDKRISATIPDYEAALKSAGTNHTIHMYEGVNHAFHNDTSSTQYNVKSAKLAWSRTVTFLQNSLL